MLETNTKPGLLLYFSEIGIKNVNKILRNKEKIKVKYTDQNGRPEYTYKIDWLQIQTLHADITGDNI